MSAAAGLLLLVASPAAGQAVATPQDTLLVHGITSELDMSAARDRQELYLEVIYDSRSTGLIAHVRFDNGRLSMRESDLVAIGLVVPAGVVPDAEGLIPLDALPGLAYRYEVATQRLILHAPPALRPVQQLGYRRPEAVEVRRDTGWLLGYDAYGRGLGGEQTLALGNSLRWFGRAGAFDMGGVTRTDTHTTAFRRLETRWTYSDPERLWTWTAGDLISGATAWNRPVRMGGVQWRKNFGVRPDLITLPMPRFTADATVPSSVELFVNNVRQFGSDVQEGPFVLDAIPRISGAGEATLVVTDALGRVTQTTVPLYVDYQRLARGLSDFSVEAGVLRRDFAGAHDTYGSDPVASASFRRGLTDTLTIETHGEVGPGVRLAGVGAAWAPGNRWGLVTSSYSHSAGDTDGGQYTIGYQRNSRRYGLDFQVLRRESDFHDLGDASVTRADGLQSFREQDRATLWFPLGRGSLALTWLSWRDRDDRYNQTRSLSWTQNIGSYLSVSASVFDDRVGGRGGGLTLSVPFGERWQASATAERVEDRTSVSASVVQRAPFEGGWGWRVQAGTGDARDALAAAEVRGRYGEATFGVDRVSGRHGSFFQAGGSLAVMDGRFFLSRRIYDAFAVVSTDGVGDVPVLTENRLYGRTDEAGYLLVPELRGWQRNRLAVDLEQLGPRYRVGDMEQMATPPDRSGMLVRFDIARITPAMVVLLGPGGEAIRAGTRGRLVPSGQPVIVGYDGEAYLEDISSGAVIELKVDGVTCRYHVPAAVETAPGPPLRRGPLPCVRTAP